MILLGTRGFFLCPTMSLPAEPLAFLPALSGALDALGLPFYLKNAAGRYEHVNAAAAALLGVESAQAAHGRSDGDMLSGPLAAALRAADQAARAQTGPCVSEHNFEFAGLRRDFTGVRIALGAGALLGVWLERSAQAHLAGELQQALAQLEEQQHANRSLRSEAEGRAQLDSAASRLVAREHFEERLLREIELASREHREFALVYVAVDALPEGRPPLGPAARAGVFEALGLLLSANTRSMDAPSRVDDERFAVLLSGVGLATAHARMEQLRRQCATQLVALGGQALRFSVSVGVSSFPHTANDQAGLLQAAEDALAEAKRRGGNHVALASIVLGASVFER